MIGPISQGGVIAAGEGRRLRLPQRTGSKAMARVAGRPLIDHTLDRFRRAGIERLTIIVNEQSDDCVERLGSLEGFDLELIVRSTPSSYASFCAVADALAPGPAVITTVDSIMPATSFAQFKRAAERLPQDAVVLGVTRHVDDESPLWVSLEVDGRVAALGAGSGTHVTAGLYVLPSRRPPRPPRGCDRLRHYLGWLLQSGHPVFGVELDQVFDIDRPEDVEQAERALARVREPEGA